MTDLKDNNPVLPQAKEPHVGNSAVAELRGAKGFDPTMVTKGIVLAAASQQIAGPFAEGANELAELY